MNKQISVPILAGVLLIISTLAVIATPFLKQENINPIPPQEQCKRSGCNGELCINSNEEDLATPCVEKPEHVCYRQANCEVQSNGSCGFTLTKEIQECLNRINNKVKQLVTPTAIPTTKPPSQPSEQCKRSGCSGELCININEEDLATPCVEKPEYTCYRLTECEVQANGQCGWTMTTEVYKCLAEF